VDFGPALIVGLIYILRGDVNIKNLRSITSTESVEHAIEDDEILVDEGYAHNQIEAVAARD
jgi:hypothetical protein